MSAGDNACWRKTEKLSIGAAEFRIQMNNTFRCLSGGRKGRCAAADTLDVDPDAIRLIDRFIDLSRDFLIEFNSMITNLKASPSSQKHRALSCVTTYEKVTLNIPDAVASKLCRDGEALPSRSMRRLRRSSLVWVFKYNIYSPRVLKQHCRPLSNAGVGEQNVGSGPVFIFRRMSSSGKVSS